MLGVALVGGRGERAQPITAKAPGYLRSKAAMSLCGRRVIWWLLQSMKRQGISDFLVVARGKENRYQTKMLVGYGEDFGVRVRYSPVRFDALNTGSADAALRDLEYWRIDEPALVFPTDSVYDFSLRDMLEAHRSAAALVTIGAMARSPEQVAGAYGVMRTRPDGRVSAFVEKPSLAKLLHPAFGVLAGNLGETTSLLTNAGMYLIDTHGVRKYAEDPELVAARGVQLDFGADLLPWLVGRHLPVHAYPLPCSGDLGTVSGYIDTMVLLLGGAFASLTPLLGPPLDAGHRIWIPPETLQLPDQRSGKTLEEKLDEGLVTIGGNVRLGKYVEVGAGAHLVDSNIDDGVEIGEDAQIRGSALRDGARVGAGAIIDSSYVGTMAQVESSRIRPTRIQGHVALGDEVSVAAGTYLSGGVRFAPRARVSPLSSSGG